MAQHDFNIANATFPAFRTDLNNFLQAVGTTHSGTSLPSGAVAGLIWLDTTSATLPILKYYDGTDNITLATINHATNTVDFALSATQADLVNDTTPQLGGDLDVQTNKVVTTANRNVKVYPNGTGVFEVGGSTNSGRIQLNCEQNTHGIKLASPAHSAGQNYTLTFPTTAPTANKVLQTDGSGNLSFATVTADGTADWDTSVKTTGFTATANKGYFLNTTSGEITVTLPSSPSAGDEVIIVDYAGTFATNNLIITATPKINGSNTDVKLTTNREATRLVYIDSTQGWLAYSGVNEGTAPSLTDVPPPPYSVDYLVVAGGGAGGGSYQSGGGGAGGMKTGTETFNGSTVYTITVGAGGTGGAGADGNSGSNSSIAGTALSTITSTGGGGGTDRLTAGNGITGGSGGGVGADGNAKTGGTGTAGQGNNGGDVNTTYVAPFNGSGGGGKGAVGVNGVSTGDGDGGAGSASSITGSSVNYAGGGGGSLFSSGYSTYGIGGIGGGGNGGREGDSYAGTAGDVNTGGGGGGATGASTAGNAGGSGVVILSMPDASYSGTTTGSPTVATGVAGKTILTFTASGSYTG